MSAWIKMISDEQADDDLRDALTLARTPHGTVDNVMRVHSLRPNSMRAHIALYRATLHDNSNTLPPWFQETISTYVSIINQCHYSLANHWANARHLIGDAPRADAIKRALDEGQPEKVFKGAELLLLQYADKLTRKPGEMDPSDIEDLRNVGIDDGQILEVNQIIGYFNYVNRCLNGLGVTTEGDTVGFYSET